MVESRLVRITIVSPVVPPKRVPEADYVWHLADKLVERGHRVEVMTARGRRVEVPRGVHRRAVMRGWSWRGLPRLIFGIWRTRPEVLITSYIGWMYGNHPMITTLPRLLHRLRRRLHVITVVHNVDHNDLDVMGLPRTRRVLRALRLKNVEPRFGTLITDSDLVVVGSHAQRDVLVGTAPEAAQRVAVGPPPTLSLVRQDRHVARGEGRGRLGLRHDDQVVGFFGYVYPGKGAETLVEAFASLAATNSRLKLAFIGGTLDLAAESGVTVALQRRLAELGLTDRVVRSGFETGSFSASTLMHALDAVALPFDIGVQLSNSSACTVLTHDLPLVTTCGGATDEAWRELGACLLVPPKDPEALADALARILTDETLRDSLRRGSQRMVNDWYSWGGYLQRIESIAARPVETPRGGLSRKRPVRNRQLLG